KHIATRGKRAIVWVGLAIVCPFAGTLRVAAQSDGEEAPPVAPERPTNLERKATFALPGDESSQYQLKTVIEGLDNPCGLLLRSGDKVDGPHDFYFSESGAGRILKFSTDDPSALTEVVVGFPRSSYGKGPSYRFGPLGLAFVDLSASKLAVGTGGLVDGQEVIQVYSLADGDELPLEYGLAPYLGPIQIGDGSSTGEGNFFGLAATDSALFVTANGDDSQGWILKATISGNKLSDLRTFIPTRDATGATGPVGVVVNPKPDYGYLVVSHMGGTSGDRDSQLTFFSPRTGKLALSLALGLFDVVALAYSPSGDLYAADFAWGDPSTGGVYRIDEVQIDGRQACQAVKIASVPHPTSLAFAPDTSLYVAAFGAASEDASNDEPRGSLHRIAGDL
ncbi:MAG: hypothetical protein AAF961_03720, partial [Planctomycetota bacterium]